MPAALVERCILAGTSERGCCPACKAPWTRVVERTPMVVREGPGRAGVRAASPGAGSRTACTGTMVSPPSSLTTGWRPSCACDAGEPVPCTVLDPFAGAGTTLLAADRLQRRGLGIELNPAYADMAVRRVTDDAPLLAWEDTA